MPRSRPPGRGSRNLARGAMDRLLGNLFGGSSSAADAKGPTAEQRTSLLPPEDQAAIKMQSVVRMQNSRKQVEGDLRRLRFSGRGAGDDPRASRRSTAAAEPHVPNEKQRRFMTSVADRSSQPPVADTSRSGRAYPTGTQWCSPKQHAVLLAPFGVPSAAPGSAMPDGSTLCAKRQRQLRRQAVFRERPCFRRAAAQASCARVASPCPRASRFAVPAAQEHCRCKGGSRHGFWLDGFALGESTQTEPREQGPANRAPQTEPRKQSPRLSELQARACAC